MEETVSLRDATYIFVRGETGRRGQNRYRATRAHGSLPSVWCVVCTTLSYIRHHAARDIAIKQGRAHDPR